MGAPTWAWIGRVVEKEALVLALAHIKKVSDVSKATLELMKIFKLSDKEAVRKAFKKVNSFEEAADDIKRSIIKELSEGYIHPISREELIRLILVGDDIAAYLKAAARKACMSEPSEIPVEVKDYAIRMAERIYDATSKLVEAISLVKKEPKKALELADEVEKIEEEVDDIRDDALKCVFEICDDSKPSTCLISKEIIDSLENSSDRCEDTGDVIRSIAVMNA